MNRSLLILLSLGALAGGLYIATRKTVAEKRQYLQAVDGHVAPFDVMTDQEINDSYELMVDYYEARRQLPQSNPLWARIALISQKYNIFT